jgi:hypothetical protein
VVLTTVMAFKVLEPVLGSVVLSREEMELQLSTTIARACKPLVVHTLQQWVGLAIAAA